MDRFFHLSNVLGGDVVQAVWFERPEQLHPAFGSDSYPTFSRGAFRYHWFLAWRYTGILRRFHVFWFFISKTLELNKKNKIDIIVAYSHMTTGLIGVLLKYLTGARLIIEIVTSPHLASLVERPIPTLGDRLHKFYSDICLHISGSLCDCLHLLFPTQLDRYPLLRNAYKESFHEFVSISRVPRRNVDTESPYVFLVGAPWYLKGVDLLIAAFRRIAADYPNLRLLVQGHFEGDPKLLALAEGCPSIEILKAVPNPLTLERMSRATIFALPSRCEGLPRVVIEAMASGLPTIGSDVGGIPTLIRNGVNGFVVPSGDVDQLEAALRSLLDDPGLADRMGEISHEIAHSQLTEEIYVQRFRQMVDRTLARN